MQSTIRTIAVGLSMGVSAGALASGPPTPVLFDGEVEALLGNGKGVVLRAGAWPSIMNVRWDSGVETVLTGLSGANAASYDGSVVVGSSQDYTHAARWDEGVLTELWATPFEPECCSNEVTHVSGDGTAHFGRATGSGPVYAVRSTGTHHSAMEFPPTPPYHLCDPPPVWPPCSYRPNPARFTATDIPFDGSVVVGQYIFSWLDTLSGLDFYGSSHACIWRVGDSMATELAPDAPSWSRATAISPDGSTVYGRYSDGGTRTFRWTESGGFTALSDFEVSDTSYDGRVCVGEDDDGLILYTHTTGAIEPLQAALTARGADLTGLTITECVGISYDARTLAGNGTDDQGDDVGWMITLNEPIGVLPGDAGGCCVGVPGLAADCTVTVHEADCFALGGTFNGAGSDCIGCPTVCPADWNLDTNVNAQDFFDFVNDFFAGSGPHGQADFNDDGNVNDQDWFDFVESFFEDGC